MADRSYDKALEWIEANPTWERPTEITLPVRERVGPTWWHHEGRGGWYAALTTHPNPSGEVLDECHHLHNSEAEAWECASLLSLLLAQEVLDAREPPASGEDAS